MISLICGIFAVSCVSKDQLQKTLADNPEILVEAIKKNPKQIIDALNAAAQEARKAAEGNRAADEAKKLEEEFKNPKKPELAANRAYWGPKDAAITIVEYSDFELSLIHI